MFTFLFQLAGAGGAIPITLDTSITISVKDLIYLGGVIGAVARLHHQNLRVMREQTRKVDEMEQKIDAMWAWFTTSLERRSHPREEPR